MWRFDLKTSWRFCHDYNKGMEGQMQAIKPKQVKLVGAIIDLHRRLTFLEQVVYNLLQELQKATKKPEPETIEAVASEEPQAGEAE